MGGLNLVKIASKVQLSFIRGFEQNMEGHNGLGVSDTLFKHGFKPGKYPQL